MSVRSLVLPVLRVIGWMRWFVCFLSQQAPRLTGGLLCGGGLLATVGWLLASANPAPLAATWAPAVWMVVIGTLLLVIGMGGLYIQHVLRAGTAGWVSFLVLLLGALALAAGATTIDVFLLPTLFKLVNQIPNVGAQIQSAYNQVQNGVNTATSTVTSTGTDACNSLAGVFGQSCGSTTAPTVPSATIPAADAPSIVNDLLVLLGFPSLATLGLWGLSFLSGASLAPGCLLLSLVLLAAGLRPRSALVLVAVCAVLNLGGQFLLLFAFLRHLSGVLLFLALAWLGVRLWFPGEIHLPLPFLTSWYDQQQDRLGLRHTVAFLRWAREESQPRSPFTKKEIVPSK